MRLEDIKDLEIIYSERKNLILEAEGRPSLKEVRNALNEKNIIDVIRNKNHEEQYFIYLAIEGRKHVCAVPCKILDSKYLVLITAYEDRKATEKYSNKFKRKK